MEDAVGAFVADDPSRSVLAEVSGRASLTVEQSADVVRPAGSLLKLAIAAALYDCGCDLAAPVERRRLGRTALPSVLEAFEPDRTFTVRELCALSLIASDNRAATFLARLVGFDAVNRTAVRLAGPNTRLAVDFRDEALGEAARENVTTAREVLRLLQSIACTDSYPDLRGALTNNLLNVRLPPELDHVRLAHKTGSLVGVVNEVGVLFGRTTQIAVAFLCDRQPNPVRTSAAIAECIGRVWAATADS